MTADFATPRRPNDVAVAAFQRVQKNGRETERLAGAGVWMQSDAC
ncbi:hypothetical protein [Paraburkholderia sp. CNPSo 3272]|nr:hypothetical protein [Paraburkholderia sp. CNPSo 3272]